MADQPRRYWCTYQWHCGNAGAARVRATARGRRPKERRAPTQGLEGTNPRTARRYFFNESRLNDLTKLLEADESEVVCGVLFCFGGLVSLRLLFFSFFSASSFSAEYTLAVVLTLVLVGMSVSVCRDASLQFHAELWELIVMIDRTAWRSSGSLG